jgi:hypothetical protein
MSTVGHKNVFYAAVVGAIMVTSIAQAQDKPIRLIAEAEDFKIVKPGWSVLPYRDNYYASTFAITFLSRMGALSAPAQLDPKAPAIAEQVVTLPRAGEFEVLARYEQPYDFSAEFDVEIVQKGKTIYKQTFGKLTDVKIWGCSGTEEARRQPMQRFFWGATDNIVWQEKGKAKLAAGEAIIRLIAAAQMDGKNLRLQAAKRNIDVICLTDDAAGREAQRKAHSSRTYLEMDGWLVQDGDLYGRVRNLSDKPLAPLFAPHSSGQHSPYYVHRRDWSSIKVLKDGYTESATAYELTGPRSLAVNRKHLASDLGSNHFKKPSDDQFLPPNAQSGWFPLGHMFDALHDSIWIVKTPGKIELELAIPNKGGLQTVKKLTIDGTQAFEIPGNILPNSTMANVLKDRYWLPEITTIEESLQWLLAQIKKFPDKGPVAKRFYIYNIMGFGSGLTHATGREIAQALGDNTGTSDKKLGTYTHWRNMAPGAVQEAINKGTFDDKYIVSYGDETHLPAIKPDEATFTAWLKKRGIKNNGAYTTDKTNPLYYYSYLCATEFGAKAYIDASAALAAKGILTGANYSPHSNYLVSDLHYIRPFKLKAMTMPWSEDYVWQTPEFSIQIMGYLTSAFRAGAKYHNLPIHMYVMPHSPGNTPANFRRSFYTCVAHGSKMINYFCGSPLAVGATENYVATRDLPMWRAIYDCSHAAGLFEDYVMDGTVRQARVGLLLSSVDEIMTDTHNSNLALHNNERKALFYALRHAQVPVDFLSEDDVVDGLAKEYDLIYVTQQWLRSDAVKALTKWAEKGGTIVAMAGGGFIDEFNKENPDVNALYGVKNQKLSRDPKFLDYILVENKPFLSKQDLPRYKPFDYVTWGEGESTVTDVGVIAWKQDIVPEDGKVIGTYKDGKPAVIEKTHGKGKAILFGFLPGQDYLRSGLPLLPVDRGSNDDSYTHFIPTEMNPELRRALVDDLLPEKFARPVICSETLVETTCIDTTKPAKRLAVPIINYSAAPLAKLDITITGINKIKSIRSVEHKKVSYKVEDGNLIVTLPLDITDMLLIDL